MASRSSRGLSGIARLKTRAPIVGARAVRRAFDVRLLAAFFAVSALAMVAAQQSDRARTEAMARRAAERLQALQREAERLASEERTVLGDLRKLEVDRQ